MPKYVRTSKMLRSLDVSLSEFQLAMDDRTIVPNTKIGVINNYEELGIVELIELRDKVQRTIYNKLNYLKKELYDMNSKYVKLEEQVNNLPSVGKIDLEEENSEEFIVHLP